MAAKCIIFYVWCKKLSESLWGVQKRAVTIVEQLVPGWIGFGGDGVSGKG